MENFKGIVSIDAETNGLWGKPFAIAAIIYDEDYNERERFFARIPDSFVTNEWVKENVLPTLSDLPVTHQNLDEMLGAFAEFWLKCQPFHLPLWHMGHIVEAYLFRLLVEKKLIGEFSAPYDFIEVSNILAMYGYSHDSVDAYAKKYNLPLPEGSTHNPLYDCEVAAKVHYHLLMNQ